MRPYPRDRHQLVGHGFSVDSIRRDVHVPVDVDPVVPVAQVDGDMVALAVGKFPRPQTRDLVTACLPVVHVCPILTKRQRFMLIIMNLLYLVELS